MIKVSNPLTIVAIFAGLAEVMATAVLVVLPATLQSIFIYFVMGFPVLIVSLFFLCLFVRPQSLYAPSDYKSEESYLKANNIRQEVSQATEKALNGVALNNQHSNDVKQISEKVAKLAESAFDDFLDSNVLEYMRERPNEAFTNRGLGHIFSTGKNNILKSLLRLEHKKEIVSGMDGLVKVWQVRPREAT